MDTRLPRTGHPSVLAVIAVLLALAGVATGARLWTAAAVSDRPAYEVTDLPHAYPRAG
jgi:hypothetical protein